METKEAKVELTEKMKSVMDTIEKMTVIELADLVKALEDKFGVVAAGPVAVAAGAPGAGGAAAPAAEEKSTFNVVLTSSGANKIQVIKELRAITSLGLKEAKDLVDGAPKTIKEGATKEEADKMKKQLEAAGAKIELK
jgi:large subunit ribosomal protein L7/L12